MTSKKYLSNKKTAQQTISITPALKEWIERYVHVKHRENFNDERYRSISAFYNHIMENILSLFEKGKTLDDFKRIEDKDIKDFFDKFTFKATIPLYEMIAESNRYTYFSFDFNTHFLLTYLNFLRSQFRSQNYEDLKLLFEKIRSRIGNNNISKDVRLEIFPDKDKGLAKGTLEFIGKYKNLHFENCKFLAVILGILGVKVIDFIYSPNDYFCRLEFLETDLLFKKELAKKERLKLLTENVDYIINYYRMLNEKDMYLWMRLAEDKGVFVSFKNQNVFNKWIKKVENHLQKFGMKEDFLYKIMKLFEKLHWIRIESVKALSFQIDQSIEKNKEQKQYLLKYLLKHTDLSEIEGIYYLKKDIKLS